MNRRAWILGGALSAASTAGIAWFRRFRGPCSETAASVLTRRSGPLALRPGFECKILMRSGQRLSDGTRSADLPDGMACFPHAGDTFCLLRNHELGKAPRAGAFPERSVPQAFDPAFVGGVSRLVLSATSLEVLSSNTILTGTDRNCGGGVSPWGFLSCEESRLPGHGYVFLCSPEESTVAPPRPLRGYGRFRHEAACVDPQDLRAYLTEDEADGCFYRFTPDTRDEPFRGRLEALCIKDRPRAFLGDLLQVGESAAVEWASIGDPDARRETTREQARAQNAAQFVRGEGVWLDGEGVVFACTTGGRAQLGQLFRLDFVSQRLTLVAEAESPSDFTHPDNLTIAPWGDIIIAEDTAGVCHLRGVTRQGRSYLIARNEVSRGELAGVCFSPDGKALFCNLQADGLTVSITGPFEELYAGDSVAKPTT